MSLVWLITLTIYGLIYGINTIPGLYWALLIVFAYQDAWDNQNTR